MPTTINQEKNRKQTHSWTKLNAPVELHVYIPQLQRKKKKSPSATKRHISRTTTYLP
jgi:hypothetical protein